MDASSTSYAAAGDTPPQLALLDFFFPGMSMFTGAIQKYLHIDLNLYIPLILLLGGLAISWQYFTDYVWGVIGVHFMSTVDVRTDDEVYNMLMSWVASQHFSKGARRFIVNTNLNSRSWFLAWRSDDDEDLEEDAEGGGKKKALAYTPTFGTHYFWYKGRLLIFNRNQNREQSAFLTVSEREEIAISCFGRNPSILKELLHEARAQFIQRDEKKTLIYRGTTRSGSTDATWQRCLARASRPFSTVILNEKVKQDLIDDVTDYLDPATRRWYSNRGIPYRRGYLLYGPPGTGKSSLSLALAGRFKLPVYMVSLSSITATEENLASLFADLPRRCVVLLEDIDTAGLTHTREEGKGGGAAPASAVDDVVVPGQVTAGAPAASAPAPGRLSLSGLLNILDGVASQEGRVLIMTTNHLEKLDKALIRPGRVDLIIKFDRADRGMIASLFRAIFAPIEGDNDAAPKAKPSSPVLQALAPAEVAAAAEEEEEEEEEKEEREATVARVTALAEKFADRVPAHEFSPAELQGFLLKHKRDPEGAAAQAAAWVAERRAEKKEKELREAEDKREADEAAAKAAQDKEAKEARKKAKKDKKDKKKAEAAKKKKKTKKAKKPAKRGAKKGSDADESSSSDSSSGSDSDSDSDSDSAAEVGEEEKAAAYEEAKKSAAGADKTAGADPEAEAEPEEKTEDLEKAEHDDEALVKPVDGGKKGSDSGYGTPT